MKMLRYITQDRQKICGNTILVTRFLSNIGMRQKRSIQIEFPFLLRNRTSFNEKIYLSTLLRHVFFEFIEIIDV